MSAFVGFLLNRQKKADGKKNGPAVLGSWSRIVSKRLRAKLVIFCWNFINKS